MENRGQKRSETDSELPADKRACSSLEFKPSSSSSSLQALALPMSSTMETTVNSSPETLPNSSSSPGSTGITVNSSAQTLPNASSSPSSITMGTKVNSSSEALNISPSSSSLPSQALPNSSNSSSDFNKDVDMETSSSSASASGRSEGDGYSESDVGDARHLNLREAQERRSYGNHGKFSRVVSCLTDEVDCSGQLAALTELCELLSFSTDGSISTSLSDQLAPLLVKSARQEVYPDVMLLAVRSITYLCDASPRASAFLVRHDAVPTLCQRLTIIEYLDIAEQCLQALEKISRDQPLACLQSGTIMAVLGYIDFFSTSVQRTAISTIVNICKKLSSESPAPFIEAVPKLCDLLQYEDRQLVEKVATCLIKIVDRVKSSPEMLNALCAQGVANQVTHLLNLNCRVNLSKSVHIGLIGLLAKFASGSADAVRILFELNIGSILRDMLSSYNLLHGLPSSCRADKDFNQVHEILKLLNELLPPVFRDQEDQLSLTKERILVDQPGILHKFGMDVLPILIQMVNSGANSLICYGCLCIINRVVHFSKPDTLYDLVRDANISSFLLGTFTRKDHHILSLGLQITETLLQKLSDILMGCFVKEGVFFAISALLVPEKYSQFSFPLINGSRTSSDLEKKFSGGENLKCLCHTYYGGQFLCSSESQRCMLEKDSVHLIAKRMIDTYFTTEQHSSESLMSDALQNLRNISSEFVNLVNVSRGYHSCIQHEEKLSNMLHQVMGQLGSEEPISSFELIESGIIKAMLTYFLGSGISSDFCGFHKKLEIFVRISLFSLNHVSAELPLLLLVRKLQGALSTVESFPVVLGNMTKPRGSYATVPQKRSTTYPCLKVRFTKPNEEMELSDYSRGVVTVDPFSSVEAIEQYLWPLVKGRMEKCTKSEAQAQEEAKEEKDNTSECALMEIKSRDKHQDGVITPSEADCVADEKPRLSADADATIEINIENEKATQTSSNSETSKEVVGKSQSNTFSSAEDGLHKLAFYLEEEQLDYSATLYQEIVRRRIRSHNDAYDGMKLWLETYSLTYKRPCETTGINSNAENSYLMASDNVSLSQQYLPFFSCLFVGKLLSDLEASSPTNDILLLLKTLEMINRFSFHLMSHERVTAFAEGKISNLDHLKISAPTLPQNEFVNSKLTEKLEQQMCDAFTVSVGALPLWCTQLMSSCPFLYSFEARCKYFQLAAFGCQHQSQLPSQTDSDVQRDWRASSGRLSRKKFLVDRDRVLDSATKMMETHANHKVMLEVEYSEEVGTGLGPTLEFFTLVSHEFQKAGLGMWRADNISCGYGESTVAADSGFVSSGLGLFPCPWHSTSSTSNGVEICDVINKFVLLGQLVGKALQDGRVLDIPFSRAFYSLILGKDLSLYDVQSFDPALGRTLLEFQAIADRQKNWKSSGGENAVLDLDSSFRSTRIEDLCLDFTLPGYPDYVLADGDDHTLVSIDNLGEYISLVLDATLRTGISRQVEAFKSGFNQVFPINHLHIFTEEELERILCGENNSWMPNELLDNIKFDHGYTASSPPIINLLEIMKEFDYGQQRAFLQFVTGAPRLPPGGLAALNPKLTIVRKHSSNSIDLDLPSVMTCVNYLKLPPYSSKETMREKILYAIMEGQGSFHLS
ncbi:E3 ubiquitin-protein ligase upl4 [Dionaea muscipula]